MSNVKSERSSHIGGVNGHARRNGMRRPVEPWRMAADDLMEQVRSYLPPDQVEEVEDALEFAVECHAGQERKSKEPFIIHPIAVTAELAKLELTADVVIAGLLHDTVEDCDVTVDQIKSRFGESVSLMVNGVTKVDELELKLDESETGRKKRRHPVQRKAARIATLGKMFVAAGEDERVLAIKLADRMHNLSTLGHIKDEEKRRQIARESIDIYSPLADLLGMNDLKWRMEDAAFQYLDPANYKGMSRLVNRKRRERERYADLAVQKLKEAVVDRAGIAAEINGRAKHLYSIFRKKQRYENSGRSFDDIHDLIALRVITDNDADCYMALAVIHGLWEAVPGTFDDYISRPKQNGYRSIHTTVRGPGNNPLEVQIRSHEMHEVDERGYAAHWAYKAGRPNASTAHSYGRPISPLKERIQLAGGAQDPDEVVDIVQAEILSEEQIHVYTPGNDIIELPFGATPLDFAYRVHTEVGHRAVGALVNGKLVRLDTKLMRGDIVEIRTSKREKGPSIDWIDSSRGYLFTSSAKAKVRQYFSRQKREITMQNGRHLIKGAIDQLRRMGHRHTSAEVADLLNYDSTDQLTLELGRTHEDASEIVKRVMRAIGEDPESEPKIQVNGAIQAPASNRKGMKYGIVVLGQSDMKVNIPKCCSPVYGDEITGYLTRGRGVTAHRTICVNITKADEPERLAELAWGHRDEQSPVRIRVEGSDRNGLIRDVTAVMMDANKAVHDFSSGEQPELGKSMLTFTTYIDHKAELVDLFSKVEEVKGVDTVFRIS